MNAHHNSAKRLYPVIHVLNEAQAIQNMAVAFEAGCDGVFLINHEDENGVRHLNFKDLIGIHAAVYTQFPHHFIGVNCLDLHATDVFQHLNDQIAAVWVDNAEIDERSNDQVQAERILVSKKRSGWGGLYFGGIAFKYQRPVDDYQSAALIATNFVDVVTTSGTATGKSASLAKIRDMKQAIGPKPLAIASGITPKNVADYLPWVDCFLVATGISLDFYQLDPQKTRQLAQIIHQA